MKADKLTSAQIMTLTSAAIFGVDILMVQQKMVQIAMQDSWLPIILGGIMAIIFGTIAYMLAALYPDKDVPHIVLETLGGFFGRILLISLIVNLLLNTSMIIRIFAQVIKMFLMYKTPLYASILFILFVSCYAVQKGIHTIAAVVDLIFPIALMIIALLIVLSYPYARMSYLEPVLFENSKNVIRGIIPGFQQFTGFGTIGYIYLYTKRDPRDTYKWYIMGLMPPLVSYTLLTVVAIMVFSPEGVLSLIYPTLTLSKSIGSTPTILERFESFTAVLWIAIVFQSVVLLIFQAVRNFTVLFNIKQKHLKYVIWGHIPVLFIISVYIKSGLKVIEFYNSINKSQIILTMFTLPLMMGIALIKKRRQKAK